MGKRIYRKMSLNELATYVAEELENCAGRLYMNQLYTKADYLDLCNAARILREKTNFA